LEIGFASPDGRDGEAIIEVRGLHYAYRGHEDAPVLKGINLDVRRSEFLVLAGRTGAGKSTLCYALLGLVPHSFGGSMEGSVRVCGIDTSRATVNEMARRASLVMQSAESQLVGLTAIEDVQFGLENLGLAPAEIVERSRRALAEVRLERFADASPWSLSGGQKQRLAIAAALAFHPEVLVLDNPTAELDPLGKAETLETIARLNRELGMTIVMVNQELEEIVEYASRLVIMDGGRVALEGPVADVLDEAETLRRVGVKLPDVTEVAYQLRRRGRWQGRLPSSVDEARVRIEELIPSPPDAVSEHAGSIAEKPATSAAQAEELIRCEALRYKYPAGPEVLRGIDLTIHRGEFVALMGPNGSGKTTLAKHFNGLLKPTAGRVVVEGIDTRERTVAQFATRVGYVFQNPDHQIFAHTAATELAFGPQNLGWPSERIAAAVERTLADLGLPDQASAAPFFMGLAERKLLALGSVLIMGPDVLVLDEPATGADFGVAQRIMRLISALHEAGLTVLIITHDVSLAAIYAERLLVMSEGRLLLDGPPRELFQRGRELESCFVTPPTVARLAAALGTRARSDAIRVSELVESLGGGLATVGAA
jgi:energy-coupling factor transport system ATP-binding protein